MLSTAAALAPAPAPSETPATAYFLNTKNMLNSCLRYRQYTVSKNSVKRVETANKNCNNNNKIKACYQWSNNLKSSGNLLDLRTNGVFEI